MQKNLVQFFLTICILALNACSFYKSEGRKNFENQAPTQVRVLSFKGCQNEDPPKSSYETLLTPQGKQVFAVSNGTEVVVHVLFEGVNHKTLCTYSAPNRGYWQDLKDLFLSEVDTISID